MKIVQETKRFDLYCKIRTCQPSDYHPFHWHDNYEICQVINKPCAFRVDGELIEAKPGDIIAVGEKTVHEFLIYESDCDIRIIQFNPNILFGITDAIVPLRAHIPYSEIEKDKSLKSSLDLLFDMMECEENTEKSGSNNYYKSITAALYFLLQRNFPECGKVHGGNGAKNDFYRIVEYINAHYTENITVNSISSHFYFSRGKLSAVFKKYSGLGVNEYINQLRVKNANMLLLQGESMTSAALASGFESVRTFNSCYKRIMGITPSEYVKGSFS